MLKRCITSQAGRKPIEAAAPNQGAAAFFCSTEIPLLSKGLWHFPISQQRGRNGKALTFHNLLTKAHYFSVPLAKCPVALVIRTEEKKKPLYPKGVTAWA